MSPRDLARWRSFWRNSEGASAVEFAIVSIPFIFLLLFIVQMSIFYMAQSSLDSGVIQAADTITNAYNAGTAPTFTASSINTLVYSKSGGMLSSTSFYVDLKKLSALASAPVPVSNTMDANAPGDVLALRAQGVISTFMPGFSAFATVRSSALLRRQGS